MRGPTFLRRPPRYTGSLCLLPLVAANDPLPFSALAEVGEQLKRARKGCIGAPAGMRRRQPALHPYGYLGSKLDEDATTEIRC